MYSFTVIIWSTTEHNVYTVGEGTGTLSIEQLQQQQDTHKRAKAAVCVGHSTIVQQTMQQAQWPHTTGLQCSN